MSSDKRPNILFIMTDQQSASMMSCTGNSDLQTPALDRLAASGVRFDRAYCTNPICVPSRFSLQTGRMPSSIGMRFNQDLAVPEEMVAQSLGPLFSAADYKTVYAGKIHAPGALKEVEQSGYRLLSADARQDCADACAEFLKGGHEKPFFMFASFVNPHDICYLAIDATLRVSGMDPIGNTDSGSCAAIAEAAQRRVEAEGCDCLPPLPANHGVPETEPETIDIEYMPHVHRGAQFRRHARDNWSETEWRIHRYVYSRLVEKADTEIGQVLDALRDSGLEKETLVVFTSDHGDMDSAHKLEHKAVAYEEAVRIPLIMSQPGVIAEGIVNEHLVSNGLDLLPTLCDAAGIECPAGVQGRSLLPVARGEEVSWRDYVVIESAYGRALHTDRYKYTVYASGANREQLIDMQNDPGEMNNLTENPDHSDELDRHRRLLEEWIDTTGDSIGAEYIIRS